MDTEFSKLNLDDDFQAIIESEEWGKRWNLTRPRPLEVWASMVPASEPQEVFLPAFAWDAYPDNAASLKFRDAATNAIDNPRAWPMVRGFRPPSLDACVNYCAEGFKLHPEWVKDPELRHDPQGNVLLRMLRTLQSEMDSHYTGRFKG